ncbi:MAG: CoB--CoM heterodisulfide reductase iron-sulfur subunit A family protein [candidate division WOR-3 bacterium]|nr:CoB--CoM heterodisulfide reductase iron-sulfur subunit A family protein [candidate division WOR-3 bacterium]
MKIGVYVCRCGGNISEVVDIKEVMSFAEKQGDVVMVKEHAHVCSDVGRNMVIEDIKTQGLDKVVVAACSPQFHGKTFMGTVDKAGLNPYVMEMANIREQCSWPHYSEPKMATEKAKDIVHMAIAKARLDEPLAKKTSPIGKRALVIGAGIAGIQAALDLGDSGFKVYLVEKEPSIGGKMVKLARTFPTEDCAACILSPKMADVPSNTNIELITNAEIQEVKGYLGNYDVTVLKRPRYVDLEKCTACNDCTDVCPVVVPNEHDEGLTSRKAIYIPNPIAVPHSYILDDKSCLGLFPLACSKCYDVCEPGAINYDEKPERLNFTVDTIIVATGYDIFDAREKKVYNFGPSENIITALDMERMIVHEAEGSPIRDVGKRIAFIQCVGSRDEQVGNEYCSRICCMYAAKLSQLMKRADPKRDVYVFYTDLRAYGKGFEEYYKRAANTGVKFIRGRVAELYEDPMTKKVLLKAEDTLSRQIIESEFDLVVLSVGMQPSEGTKKVSEQLHLIKSPGGFIQEAHPKFRPVDTLTDGVFICGCAQGPKDIPDTVAQASAAAARAIRLMNKGEYEVEPITAIVDEDLCCGCGTCVSVCPYDAIKTEMRADKRVAKVNEILCQGCGSCSAACPSGASQQHWFRTVQLRAMINAALGEEES